MKNRSARGDTLSIGAQKHLAPIDTASRTKKMREKYYGTYRRSKFRPHRGLGQGASVRRDHSGCSGHCRYSIWSFQWFKLSGRSGFSPAVLAIVDKFKKGQCIETFAALPIVYEIAY
jgi:hypothetical protein